MKEAFDTATLLIALSPNPGTIHDRHGHVIPDAKQRVEFLIAQLEESRTQVVIPAPVFSELLVRAENAASDYFQIINSSKRFKIEPFDARAAVEAAAMLRTTLKSTGKRNRFGDPWPKVKVDHQIVAIAKVSGVNRIYPQDKGLIGLARRFGIPTAEVAGLPLPPAKAQTDMQFPPPNPTKRETT